MLLNNTASHTSCCKENCGQGENCPLHPSKMANLRTRCDELGVCQGKTPRCNGCTFPSTPVYIGPERRPAATDPHCDDADWIFDTTWKDWAGAVLILVILGAICEWAAR